MRLLATVLLEGPNGAGKSTLGAFLGERLGCPVEHSGGPKSSAAELREVLARFAALDRVVVDRFPAISQIAYDVALGRAPLVPHDELRAAVPRGSVIVYCRPSNRVVEEHRVEAGTHRPAGHAAEAQAARRALRDAYDATLPALAGRLRALITYDRDVDRADAVLALLVRLKVVET